MRFLRQQFENPTDENIFWASMSDLLLGLTIVFVAMFALSIIGLTKHGIEKQTIKYKITEKLTQEFKKNNIPVEIDKLTGTIKISDLELFELNQWTISDKGKRFLNKVVPTYFDTVLGNPEIRKNISQIIIEGHSDSQSYRSLSKNENYIKNLDLSIKRASAVTEYVIRLNFSGKDKYKDDLTHLLSTNGKSFSDPVLVNSKEDFTKSRRVELKFQIKDVNFLDTFMKYKFKPNS